MRSKIVFLFTIAMICGAFPSMGSAGDLAFQVMNPGKDQAAVRVYSIPTLKLAQATPRPATSTCAKRDNACSGTCVGNDSGKSCGVGGVQSTGCICK
jgi:hypothetical protein